MRWNETELKLRSNGWLYLLVVGLLMLSLIPINMSIRASGNQPPTAIAEPEYQEVVLGEAAWFNGNESYDPDGYIVSYEWDFGDGSTGSGTMISHVYTDPGEYDVSLTVVDDHGASDTDWASVWVPFGQPSVTIDLPIEGANICHSYGYVIQGSASDDDKVELVQVAFDDTIIWFDATDITDRFFGPDGPLFTEPWTRWAYSWDTTLYENGEHTIFARAWDGELYSELYSVNILLGCESGQNETDLSPVAIIQPEYQIAHVGDVVYFDGSQSYDPDGYITSYEWNFGDGSFGNGVTASHVYTSSGNYTIILAVIDNEGATDTDTAIVAVLEEIPPQNQPPVAIAEPEYQEVVVGEVAWFNGDASYDPDGYIVSYEWDFGDGSTCSGIIVSHVYTGPGYYNVSLKVTDNLGATDTDIVYISVQESSSENYNLSMAQTGNDLNNIWFTPTAIAAIAVGLIIAILGSLIVLIIKKRL